MKLAIINGPNLNFLGIREPALYGTESYASLVARLEAYGRETGIELTVFQSNHEGALVDEIQAQYGRADGIILNPGAYTHTSIALLDALLAVGIPTVEVHLSDPARREPFRATSYVRSACVKTICGHGTDGYFEAIDFFRQGGVSHAT